MPKLRTAEEMYQYCLDNGYGKGVNTNWGIKHFKIIENNLLDDETVLMTFMGLYNHGEKGNTDQGFWAFAITDKRILLGQKKIIGERFKIISLDMVNDISSKKGLALGDILFDTIKETFKVTVAKESVQNILDKIHETLFNIPRLNTITEVRDNSTIDMLKDLKELLDSGVLTQEEFEKEKHKILNQ